jgi:hypothetical protein
MSTNCEICEQTITGDGDDAQIFTLGQHMIVCSTCHSDRVRCRECGGYKTRAETEHLNSYDYCTSCIEDADVCWECNEHCLTPYHAIYDNISENTFCSSCASESPAYECEQCDRNVCIQEVHDNYGADYIDERMCSDCYENKVDSVWIGSFTGTKQIDMSPFDDAYLKASLRSVHSPTNSADLTDAQNEDNLHARMHHRVFADYYSRYESLDHNHMLLRKSAFGYGQRGWYKTEVEVSTPVAVKISRMLDYLICENTDSFYRPHKKLGRVQPFAELFSDLCHFYIRNKYFTNDRRERVEYRYPVEEIAEYKQVWTDALRDCKTDDERMKLFNDLSIKHGKPYVDMYVDHLNRDKLKECVKSRKLPDGRPLIQTVNKIINAMTKQAQNDESLRAPFDILDSYNKNYWNDYCTNGLTIKLPVSIGFGANAHNKVQSFNENVGSCQSHDYISGLGFNHISMQSNPHLFLLIHHPQNPETIIGRCVIRFWYKYKEPVDATSTVREIDYSRLIVAPSRLYLTEYTNVKRDVYTQVFNAVHEWLDKHGSHFAGGSNASVVAYCRSKHDDYSIANYLQEGITRDSGLALSDSMELRLATEFYYPVWLEKPDTDSLWTYYNDEYQACELARVGKSNISSFAIRETYEGNVREVERQE